MILKKLRIRFIIINMCLISAVLVAIFLANTISTAQKVASNSYSYLIDDKRHINIFPIDDSVRKDLPPSAFPYEIIWVKVSEDSTEVLNASASDLSDEYIQEITDAVIEAEKQKGLLRSYDLRFVKERIPSGETIIGFIDVSYEQTFIYEQIIIYLLIGLASLAVFFIISFFLSKVVIKPTEKAFKQQQQFISDASHELKTPITVILANTSIIQNKKDDKNAGKWVKYIENEAIRMKKLVEDLLFLARLDETDKITFKTSFNLSDALYECVLPFEPVAFESGVSIKNEISPDVYIKGNADQIKRVILILLDNACKYSPEGSEISVKLKSSGGKVRLSVQNAGSPIPADEISKIFDRFYRVDKARERSSDSYGLGLSMAKKIVESHKGEIGVISDKTNGTVFTVSLTVSAEK